MEVVIMPSQSLDFGFNSTRSSPQLTLSAPTSPPHLSRFYKDFDGDNGDDFAFDVSQDCETASLSAEDLFDGGVIKRSKPPPPRLPQATEAAAPQHRDRGRDRGVVPKRRAVRSLSPTRDPQYLSKGPTKKWRLKDFCLFRSASEGRSVGKDPLKKYTAACSSKRRGPVSAHELHYTVNRAVSEDLMKKTFLPYKQGILGRLAFNPAVHALSNGFGFSRK